MEDLVQNIFEISDLITQRSKKAERGYKVIPKHDMDDFKRVLLFENNQKSFFVEAEYLGTLVVDDGVWIWSWSQDEPKERVELAQKLIKYGLDYNKDKINREDFKFIRHIVTNSRLKLENSYDLDIIIGIIGMLAKIDMFSGVQIELDNKKIIQYYSYREDDYKKKTQL